MYTNKITQICKRGYIYYADLSPVVGSEQGGIRPIVIIQNDIGNKHSPTVIVAAITSQINKAKLPTHVEIKKSDYIGLDKDSVILLEQQRTLDKRRLGTFIGFLNDRDTLELDYAIKVSSQTNKINSELDEKIHSIVKNITIIDGFITRSIKKGIDASIIYDDFSERNCLICELRDFCTKNRIDMRRYYNEKTIEMPLMYAYN